jgi:CorA-like Mg2+ transporter protein
MAEQSNNSAMSVRHFRQILLWPLQLMPIRRGTQIQEHWEVLGGETADNPWRELLDEFTPDGKEFQLRHYSEFVTFLPYVQRFLYGESRVKKESGNKDTEPGSSPMRVYRRHDIASVRIVTRAGAEPIVLSIAHIDLYFFYDIDVVLLNVEVHSDDLTLPQAQEVLYRFGRAYPAGWDERGDGLHCLHALQWLAADGTVLAQSDSGDRDKFLSFVSKHRAPRISSHWSFLMKPLVLDHSDEQGAIRYRQIEFYRMPVMGLIAVDEPRQVTRNDFIRLGLGTGASEKNAMPYSESHVADFEQRYCDDRFWCDVGPSPNTRYLASGRTLIVVGDAQSQYFLDNERGVLGQFRHQHFLLFLIAHFQRAALLMFADRLAEALKRLDIGMADSVRRFKRSIRQNFEIFLRFTHRYWFHEVSEQSQARSLFDLTVRHLQLDALYDEVRDRIHSMNQYLETDSLRRQANTVLRLTVVTTFGLIGTITTGFIGMNLIGLTEISLIEKIIFFVIVFAPTAFLTFYTIVKSRRLSDFLDALSDEAVSARDKWRALFDVWRKKRVIEE